MPAVKLTVRRFSYPWYFRALDRALVPLAAFDSVGNLAPQHLARSAFRAVGEGLPSPEQQARWLGPEFEQVMRLLTRGSFSALGQIHWRAILVAAAAGRIRLERYLADGRPLGEVREPIFVVGLPRTGTSLVQRLIAEDPARRGLRTFELQTPIPGPQPSLPGKLKRRAYAALISLIYGTFMPELLRIHHTSVTSLEECWMLFMPSYAVLNADYILVPEAAFGDYLLEEGLEGAYGRYRKLLSILALEEPGRPFVLKSPEHLWFLPALLRTFPDARVIWTHRDPASAVPSYCAQASLPCRQHRGHVDPRVMGERVMHRFLQGVERGARACDEFPSARIAHVKYEDLTRDPVGVIQQTYGELGLVTSPEHERSMQAFLERPQKDKHKNHYQAEVFGLDEARVRAAFSGYMERFGIEPELKRRDARASVARLLNAGSKTAPEGR